LSYHGKSLGLGFITALANSYINPPLYSSVIPGLYLPQNPNNHLLKIQLDDCNMKDSEFAVILEAVQNTKHYYPSL